MMSNKYRYRTCECGHYKCHHRSGFGKLAKDENNDCMKEDCPCVDYTFKKEIIPEPEPVLNYGEEPEIEPVINTSTDVVRGNDELAFWLKQAKEGSNIEVTIAYSLHNPSCPLCGTHTDLFKEMMQHITIVHMQNYDREIGKAFHTKREYINDGNRIKQGPIIFDRFYSNYEMDVLNKTIAMLQVLIKYEVNNIIRNKPKQARKRAECLYRLSKEFLLTEKQIMHLVDLPSNTSTSRIYELLARGMDEYYGGEKNYPEWMQRVLQTNK